MCWILALDDTKTDSCHICFPSMGDLSVASLCLAKCIISVEAIIYKPNYFDTTCTLITKSQSIKMYWKAKICKLSDWPINLLFYFLLERLTVTSALYQLNYGVLCDMMVLKPEFSKGSRTTEDGPIHNGTIQYYYELPTEWALDQDKFKLEEHVWVILLKDYKAM